MNNKDFSFYNEYKSEFKQKDEFCEEIDFEAKQEIIEAKMADGLSFLQKVTALIDARYQDIKVHYNKRTNSIDFNINDEIEDGMLSYHGTLLGNLQYLLYIICNKYEFAVKVKLYSRGFRRKREKKVLTITQKAINDVLRTSREKRITSMDSYERFLIHNIVSKTDGVVSFTVGRKQSAVVLIKPDDGKVFYSKSGKESVHVHQKDQQFSNYDDKIFSDSFKIKSKVNELSKCKITDDENSPV